MPFGQGTSLFKLFCIKEHAKSGIHNVSVVGVSWLSPIGDSWDAGHAAGIMALLYIVSTIVQSYWSLMNLEGDAGLIALNIGTIIPSYHSPPANKEILCFIAWPFHASHGDIVRNCLDFFHGILFLHRLCIRDGYNFGATWGVRFGGGGGVALLLCTLGIASVNEIV